MSEIHLGMIVRNEYEVLGSFLKAIDGLPFGLKVAHDQGSSDHTVRMLVDGRFNVAKRVWPGSFAEARNRLVHAFEGIGAPGWVLMLDADEAISSQSFFNLQRLLRGFRRLHPYQPFFQQDYDADAVAVARINLIRYKGEMYQEIGNWPDFQARCVRINSGVTFTKSVHEELRDGRVCYETSIIIHHYGWLKSPADCWRRSQNYENMKAGLPEVEEIPEWAQKMTSDEFFEKMSERHKFIPFHGEHPWM